MRRAKVSKRATPRGGLQPTKSLRVSTLRLAQIAIDATVLTGALWLGYCLRFDWNVPAEMHASLLALWPFVVGLEYATLLAVGVPRYLWRYTGLREVRGIAVATALSSLGLAIVRTAYGAIDLGNSRTAQLPYGVIAINCMLAFLGVVGVRIIRRLLCERTKAISRSHRTERAALRTLLVGAGQGGVTVAKEIANHPEMGITPVGFLDDNAAKHGTLVHGLPVLGSVDAIEAIATKTAAKQVLITVSNAHGRVIRRISDLCSNAGLRVRFVPSIEDLVEGRTHQFGIRDVVIGDLLRRAPVQLDLKAIANNLRGRRVMVTGAGGSIGSELCRQVMGFAPKSLILLERTENALFEVHRELSATHREQPLVACIADVGDEARIEKLLAEHRPEVLFHAAAHKHVPMMEANPLEAVKNNVLATCRLADAAARAQVQSFVMVSTDKAVCATSVMGATKRAAEIYIQAKARCSATQFVTVRFGNVLGSTGSVVPIFKEQIARGGPITVTHPEMTRYFMTIPEASQLILQAGTMGAGGEIFILDMGDAVKIVDLAKDLIRLSGFREGEIPIEFTGVRPGEKLLEQLCAEGDETDRTVHPKILVARTEEREFAQLDAPFCALAKACSQEDAPMALSLLRNIVHDFRPTDVAATAKSAVAAPQRVAPHAAVPPLVPALANG